MIDNVLTVIGLIAFVAACVAAGLVLNKFKHRRFTREWQPLIGVIGGEVHEDPQGGGASSWLAGQWKGHTIHARMTPAVREWEWSMHRNLFAVGVAEQDGRLNWRTIAGFSLDMACDDAAMGERLRQAGVIAKLEQAGRVTAWYERHSRYLFVEEDVAPEWVPPRERFVVLLDLAVELAQLQRQVNV